MNRIVSRRWLATAARATALKKTAKHHRLMECLAVLEQAGQDSREHSLKLEQVGAAWRKHLSSERINPALLDLFRRHALVAVVQSTQLELAESEASHSVAVEEDELRQLFHLKQALDSLEERRGAEATMIDQQQLAREANEAWSARLGLPPGGCT